MGKTYRRDQDDWEAMLRRSAARKQARKLAQLAWGDAAIADQGYQLAVHRAPTR
jgi:hypothetical protein